MNLDHLTERLHRIRDTNDWKQFHSPKNLAMAASVEMAELVEIFQWLSEDQSRQLPADKLAHAGQEVGDIVLYLLLLCSELGLDMDQVVKAKLADSEGGLPNERPSFRPLGHPFRREDLWRCQGRDSHGGAAGRPD